MSDERDKRRRPKDMRLVKPNEPVEPRVLDEATAALRRAVSPGSLDAVDHEAILALTLGDAFSEIDDAERAAADHLRGLLDGMRESAGGATLSSGEREELGGLADLAGALFAAHVGARAADALVAGDVLLTDDHEAILALTLGSSVVEWGEEAVAAEALRCALDRHGTHPLAELAASLRACAQPAPLAGIDNELFIALTVDETSAYFSDHAAAAAVLTEALEGDGWTELSGLVRTLRATRGDTALAAEDNDSLVALVTGAEVLSSDREREGARRLAVALDGEGSHRLLGTAHALRAAHVGGTVDPGSAHATDLDQLGHERLLKRAFESAVEGAATHLARRDARPATGGEEPRSMARRGALVGAIVALAAGFALFFGSMKWLETRRGPVADIRSVDEELITTRSTTDLFDPLEKFPTRGGESERMNKIVASRAADLRRNRFARWGVQ